MKYPINLKGFEGQTVELQSAGLISSIKLLVNGQPAPKGKKRGDMLLRRDDGQEVVARFKSTFMDVPSLLVDGQIIRVVEPLKWYEWIWNALPLLIVFSGGFIPILIGFVAASINLSIFRKQETALAKYGLTGLVTFAAFIIFLLLALVLAFVAN